MITLQGVRNVCMVVRVTGIKENVVELAQEIHVEGELLRESAFSLHVGESITQTYSLDVNGQPLTNLDLLALLKGKESSA